MTLPVLAGDTGLLVIDPQSGEALPARDASDHAILHAAEKVGELDRQIYEAKRVLAAELRQRYGVGSSSAGGYRFTVAESQSWPLKATTDALDRLVADGRISEADAQRAMPSKPKPDTRALKALAGRLAVSDPDAAKVLAEACTVSPASIRDLHNEAVEGSLDEG
jgi:hypothetical protein